MGKAGKTVKNTPKESVPAAKIAGNQKSSAATLKANANSIKALQSEQDMIVPSFKEGACKFSNSLIASTSDKCDTIFVWEP